MSRKKKKPKHEELNQARWNQDYNNYLLEAEGVSQEVIVAREAVGMDEFTERVGRGKRNKDPQLYS